MGCSAEGYEFNFKYAPGCQCPKCTNRKNYQSRVHKETLEKLDSHFKDILKERRQYSRKNVKNDSKGE